MEVVRIENVNDDILNWQWNSISSQIIDMELGLRRNRRRKPPLQGPFFHHWKLLPKKSRFSIWRISARCSQLMIPSVNHRRYEFATLTDSIKYRLQCVWNCHQCLLRDCTISPIFCESFIRIEAWKCSTCELQEDKAEYWSFHKIVCIRVLTFQHRLTL